jgi:hypothetical protein
LFSFFDGTFTKEFAVSEIKKIPDVLQKDN